MSGSLTKRGKAANKWTLRFDLEPDPDSGKRRQKTVSFSGNKREAEKELARLITLAGQGQINTAQKLTVAQYLTRWLEDEIKPNAATGTYNNKVGCVRNHLIPLLGTTPLDKLRTADIVHFLARLRDRALAPTTQGLVYTHLKHALHTAVQWKLIAVNPCSGITPPRTKSQPHKALSAAESQSFLQAAAQQSEIWHAFFALAITTGMRLGELRGLHWNEIDLEEKRALSVVYNAQRITGEGVQLCDLKTKNSYRQIALGKDMVILLRRYRAIQNQQRLLAGAAWQGSDLVFTDKHGAFIGERVIRNMFAKLCAIAGITHLRIHDLRHTAATLMMRGSVHIKVASERMGNSIQTMLRVYAHVSEDMQREAAETLDSLLVKRS